MKPSETCRSHNRMYPGSLYWSGRSDAYHGLPFLPRWYPNISDDAATVVTATADMDEYDRGYRAETGRADTDA